MKKNFFKKKLASGLALALVIASLAPAGISASAATATKIVKQGGAAAPTVLYVGDKGTDYSLSNVYKTNTYSWKISNSKIATINAKTGVVTPKAPGTVNIRVTARNAKTNKWLKDFVLKLTIKQRVDKVDIGSEDFSLVMGEEKDLNAVKNPKTSTDVLVYASSDEKVATVDAKTGVVKTVAPGEATITVYAKATSATALTSKYNRTDSVKVTVLDGIQDVKQISATKLNVTLATDQSKKLTKDNLVITNASGVKQIIKEVSFSADGKVATVELYVGLTDKATYKVSYDNTSKDFVASLGEVAQVVVDSKTVQFATPTSFTVKLLDANGVDVTTTDLLNRVTYEYDLTKASVDSVNRTITVFNYGESVVIKATYHTYTYTDAKENVFEGSATINSVKELPKLAKDVAYTVAKNSADWNKVSTNIPATEQGFKLFIKAKNQDNADLTQADFAVESTDPTVLSLTKDGTDVYLYPVKAGTAYVKATYGDTTQMLAVTVGAASTIVSVVPDKTSVTLSDSGALVGGDSATITFAVKDQYGNDVTLAAAEEMKIESLSANVAGTTVSVNNNGTAINTPVTLNGAKAVTFSINGAVNATATNTYKITFLGRVFTVAVNVGKVGATPTDADVTYISIEKNTDKVDVVAGANAQNTDVTLTAYGYNASGYKVKVMPTTDFTITLNGKAVNNFSKANGVATFNALEVAPSVPVTQAAVGTYAVTATVSASGSTRAMQATTSFAVTNSQAVPTVKLATNTVNTNTTLSAALLATVDVSAGNIVGAKAFYAGAEVTNFNGNITGTGTITVTSVTVQETIGGTIVVNHVVPVSYVIYVK